MSSDTDSVIPTPTAVQPPLGLAPNRLNVAKEETYYVWVVIISVLAWLLLVVTVFGLIYAIPIGFFLWLGSGLLAAYLRAEAVRVGPDQLPALHTTFQEVCQRLNVTTPPALYVLQSGGLLNAFATRFAGRDFVVIYSDMLEAVGPASAEMKFILGHEIGHLKSGHVLKQIVLAPGMLAPLVGPAYRRAWETSCDRYGAYAAQDTDAAVRAMLVLSGGRENGPRLNPSAFSQQHHGERGFFVSLHELTSTYPTLSRRVTDLLALKDNSIAPKPERHPLAYLMAFLTPGGSLGQGGPAGALIFVVLIGLMAAMAIPAFQKVRENSIAMVCKNQQAMLAAALDQFALENRKGASSWDDIVGPKKYIANMPVCPSGGEYSADNQAGSYVVTCSHEAHNQPVRGPAKSRHP